MPGGQYTNLREQAVAMGLGHRWREIARTYADDRRAFDYQIPDNAWQRSEEDPPLLQFGGSDARDQIGGDTNHNDNIQVSSLLVDIRNFSTIRQIEIELYGKIDEMMGDELEELQIVGKQWSGVHQILAANG